MYLPEAEEVTDLLVIRATGNVLDVNCCGRHDEVAEGLNGGMRIVVGR